MIFQDYEQVPEVPNYRNQDHRNQDYHDDRPQHQQQQHSEDDYYEDYPQEDSKDQEGPPRQQYQDYEMPRNADVNSEDYAQDNPDYAPYEEYEDYNDPGSGSNVHESRSRDPDSEPDDKGYNDYYASDGALGDFFDQSQFDNFFKKLETGIEDEITTSPNYMQHRPRGRDLQDDESNQHHQSSDDESYNRSFDGVTYGDLRPDSYDNNHPDSIDFNMPSHDDLQKNYKTVSTSASEIHEHVVEYKRPRRRRIRMHRLTSKH